MVERRQRARATTARRATLAGLVLGAVGVPLLALWSNALLFHCLVELYAMVVAACIAMIAWNTRALRRDDYMMALGVAMVPIAAILAFHVLSDPGMRVFVDIKPAASAQLGLLARMALAGALLIAPRFLDRELELGFVFPAVMVLGVAFMGAVLHTGLLPTAMGEGLHHSPLLHGAHALVVVLYLGALGSHLRARSRFDPRVLLTIVGAIVLAVAAELCFASTTASTGRLVAAGHITQLLCFVLLYWALIHSNLAEPYTVLFRQLTESLQSLQHEANRDQLTGLYNRRGLMVLGDAQLALAQRLGLKVTVIFADLNGLKRINDQHGHAAGDQALVDAAELLRSTFRDADVLARVGGDEFVVLLVHGNGLQPLGRLREAIARFVAEARRPYTLSIAVGATVVAPGQPGSLDDILASADAEMYTDKQRHYADRGDEARR